MLFIKFNKRLSFFLILTIINLFIIKSLPTDFEMERVCSSAEFDKADHKNGYRTIQHYADDDNIELTKAHPFYRSIFLEGKRSNLNKFINSIILELVIFGLSAIALINYFLFLFIWCGHCCIFKIYTDKEKFQKQKNCKYCSFIVMLVYFFISIALSVIGILFISYYKKSLKLSDCGLLRFTSHGLYGTGQNFAGSSNLKDTFLNTSYSLNKIETFYARMFTYYNNIIDANQEFKDKLDGCNSLSTNDRIYSPNPDSELFHYITMSYQPIYGPKTNSSTLIGRINQKYEDKIKPIVEALTNLKSYFERLILNKNAYISELKKYGEYFDTMKMMYETINRNIGKEYTNYMKSGSNVVYTLAIILYVIFPLIIIIIIIFIFIYICQKEATIFVKKYVRLILHVLWNILFVFSILGIILSGYIGTYRKYSYNLILSFNQLISSDTIKSKTSEENLFIEFANNSDISKSLELFSACYNSTQSTNIANLLGIQDTLLYYFDLIYQDYNNLLQYVYNNSLDENINPFVTEKMNILDDYLYNITKTTSYATHRENDISIYIKELNRYTNYGDANTYQIRCPTNVYDIWVTNRDDCPSGYTYSLDARQTRNCLVISEWTADYYNLRYRPVCKTIREENTRLKVDHYLGRLQGYYDLNKQLIINMKNGAESLLNLHNYLINNISLEMSNDNETFLNFTLPYSLFTNDTNIFSVFDCGILKDDLIDFYYYTRHKLSTISIIHIIFLLLVSIFNIAGVYLLIRILFIFNRTTDEEENENSEPEEIEIQNPKSKKNSSRPDDKDILSIRKKSKNSKEGNKGSDKAKTYDKETDKMNEIKGTKSKLYVGFGKNRSDDTPSSSEEKLRTTQGNFDKKSSEESDTEENNKNKDSDTSNEEDEIKNGIRDNGSAMS